MKYSPEQKEAVVKKMMPPYNRSLSQLAKEEGINEATLYKGRTRGFLLADGESNPAGWTARDQFAAVIETH